MQRAFSHSSVGGTGIWTTLEPRHQSTAPAKARRMGLGDLPPLIYKVKPIRATLHWHAFKTKGSYYLAAGSQHTWSRQFPGFQRRQEAYAGLLAGA